MKLKNLACSAVFFSILLIGHAQAQNIADTGWYVGGKLSQVDLELQYRSMDPLEFDGPMLEARGGFRFSPYFALESTLGLTPSGSTNSDYIDDSALLKFSTAAKLIAPVSDKVQLYANAGLALLSFAYETRDNYSYNDDTESYVGNCFLLGLGVEFEVAPHLILHVAYDSITGELEHSDDDYYNSNVDLDATFSQIGVGLHYQF
ncbi:porin family protein [Marinagarivorans cellulosilyticus]|uniref:Outer membrane protein beta-barrel domain-containing protein n=1 Tax=Marinagarivorans cellulosilyticus TaxID=2721545 RepID=A0AAN1WGL8_9GAMM|nr:porin family protein [Marinagarivorans cellulosilyticus]BCD97214.1 hypothetical protein MARGE09_P1415 [Marinagarivorans cellulosilyticus]